MLLGYCDMHLTRLDHCTQHHFMALSTLNPPLPALEDLITLTPRRVGEELTPECVVDKIPKKIG
jgi:hypothetical protein